MEGEVGDDDKQKKKAGLWKVLEAVGKDRNRGSWHKLLT